MKILGLSCFFHDSSACLIDGDRIVAAAQEERFSRIKHDNNFPKLAIEYCLKESGLAINEIDAIAFYEKPLIKFGRILHQHLEHFPKSYPNFHQHGASWITQKLDVKKILRDEFHYYGKVVFVPHHLSHAASSYYLSPFQDAAMVTIDGVGEWSTTTLGVGKNNTLTIDQEIRFPHSLGLLYSAITAYLGFKVNSDEYKVMGLSAYGRARTYSKHFTKLITEYDDGSYALNMAYFEYDYSNKMYSEKLERLFGRPTRKGHEPVRQYHADIAAALQAKLEKLVFSILNHAHQKYETDNLCLAGGVALNSLMNGKISSQTPFKNVFIPPDPGDGGGSMGAALYVRHLKTSKRIQNFTPYLGPQFSWAEIQHELEKKGLKYKLYTDKEKLLKTVAKLIQEEKVIGWFQGRMEWGPRALGSRSILASATHKKMKEIINLKVKKREEFRPFAPVILEEKVDEYFEGAGSISDKYMLMVYPFTSKGARDVPATVHVDGTGRLQVVGKTDNPDYYNLIREYEKLSGIPVIINTSFNVQEPIVCTPEDGINCFLRTEIDALVIDQYLVVKGK